MLETQAQTQIIASRKLWKSGGLFIAWQWSWDNFLDWNEGQNQSFVGGLRILKLFDLNLNVCDNVIQWIPNLIGKTKHRYFFFQAFSIFFVLYFLSSCWLSLQPNTNTQYQDLIKGFVFFYLFHQFAAWICPEFCLHSISKRRPRSLFILLF